MIALTKGLCVTEHEASDLIGCQGLRVCAPAPANLSGQNAEAMRSTLHQLRVAGWLAAAVAKAKGRPEC